MHDRRREARRRTRLRPAKLLSQAGRFLCDCTMVEHSPHGARVRAFAPVQTAIPDELFLFDEVESHKHRARIVWANGAELGLVFDSLALAVETQERHRIAGRFYAVSP
ncbi:PilZ domain-containing protein [Aureimonas sp. AU40]|uniref:PilZ domain-containing protein n=1 Tax=Aureimonas sp. AU40 TaxID=1637747 RepID=UPI000AA9D690|nr:PilZ domain-containing protein [Aureimonas sp. AU40]